MFKKITCLFWVFLIAEEIVLCQENYKEKVKFAAKILLLISKKNVQLFKQY